MNTTQESIRDLLRQVGPLSTVEIAGMLGVPGPRVSVCISCWRRSGRHAPPRVKEWQRREGFGGSPTAIWACGLRRDAPRPTPFSRAERSRLSRRRHATILAARRRGVAPDPLISVLPA